MGESYQHKLWRSHFAQDGSPSPMSQTRSQSPAPRRSMHLPSNVSLRPGLAPRTSSLAHLAGQNHSTSSLGTGIPTSSVAKSQRGTEHANPLKILESILGRPVSSEKSDAAAREPIDIVKPSILNSQIDFGSVSLEEFAKGCVEIQKQPDLGGKIPPIVGEYETKKDNFDDLHKSIQDCDEVLRSVEVSLTNFQRDLGDVSAEIETLQSRSTSLSTRLDNRKVVEQILGPAVEEIAIPPPIIKTISQGPIDQKWVHALKTLEKLSTTIEVKLTNPVGLHAASDAKPLLGKLNQKAVERIRDYLVSQIKGLRSPNINAQVIQQDGLDRFRDLYAFLARQHQKLAEEIAQAYINTMRWYYLSHFSRYQEALYKVPRKVVDKVDALGADPRQRGTPNNSSSSSQDLLSLGRRADILGRHSSNALSSYLAEELHNTQSIETIFHSFNIALIDNASAEYGFLNSFFSPLPIPVLSRHFSSIFGPTFALGQSLTKSLTETTFDCLGILLCVRVMQQLAFSLQRRKVPVVEGYINGTNMLLWPRFQLAMDMHIDSLRRATAAVSPSRALSLSSASSPQSTAPHHLTQRFGVFLQGILALSSPDIGADTDIEPVGASLGRLRDEVVKFLNKVAKGLPQGKRERFLANNWSLFATIVGETEGNLATETREWVEALREGVGG